MAIAEGVEILTNKGFIFIEDYNNDCLLASYNPEKDKVEFCLPFVFKESKKYANMYQIGTFLLLSHDQGVYFKNESGFSWKHGPLDSLFVDAGIYFKVVDDELNVREEFVRKSSILKVPFKERAYIVSTHNANLVVRMGVDSYVIGNGMYFTPPVNI